MKASNPSSSQAQPPWLNAANSRFSNTDSETDPLTGFANIMDVMLVFALGLMLALVTQSSELKQHFSLSQGIADENTGVPVQAGKELLSVPESMQNPQGQMQGMESLGQVYKDPKTGKLILVGGQ